MTAGNPEVAEQQEHSNKVVAGQQSFKTMQEGWSRWDPAWGNWQAAAARERGKEQQKNMAEAERKSAAQKEKLGGFEVNGTVNDDVTKAMHQMEARKDTIAKLMRNATSTRAAQPARLRSTGPTESTSSYVSAADRSGRKTARAPVPPSRPSEWRSNFRRDSRTRLTSRDEMSSLSKQLAIITNKNRPRTANQPSASSGASSPGSRDY